MKSFTHVVATVVAVAALILAQVVMLVLWSQLTGTAFLGGW